MDKEELSHSEVETWIANKLQGMDPKWFAKKLANWMINDLMGLMNKYKIKWEDCPVPEKDLYCIVISVEHLKILSRSKGKEILKSYFEE